MKNTVVSTKWLSDHLDDPNLIIIEVGQKVNIAGLVDQAEGSIKGSQIVDIKTDLSDAEGKYPNTFPTTKIFEAICHKLGITKDSQVVVVDRLGIYTSPRVWFIFRTMGHENIAVLDGGLPAWIKEGYKTEDSSEIHRRNGNFQPQRNHKKLKSIDDIKTNIENQNSLLIDARSAGRFDGTESEPRKALKSGSIPNSVNIPFKCLLKEGKYKSKEELQDIFSAQNVGSKPLIFSCGSGITACIVMLAAELILDNEKAVFDGSWTEWATENNLHE